MTSTKKSLLASGLSILICVALLLGTTFAWFTDLSLIHIFAFDITADAVQAKNNPDKLFE